MNDLRRSRRDAGLAAVNRWTRRAIAGGVVTCGVLGMGLAHLLPGQAAEARHTEPTPAPTSAETGPSSTGEQRSEPPDDQGPSLAPPRTAPRPSHHHPHATSGGS